MTFPHQELEKELRNLKPVAPDEALKARLSQALEKTETVVPGKVLRLWPMASLAAVACLGLAVLVFFNAADQTTETPVMESPVNELVGYEPVEAEQRLLKAIDEGIFLNEDNEPVRRLRYEFVDAVTLVNQDDGSVFRMELPREEILFVPVSLL